MLLKCLVSLCLMILFSACNVESGKSIPTGQSTTQTVNQTTSSQTGSGATSSSTSGTVNATTGSTNASTSTPATSTTTGVNNDQVQSGGVPTAPDFGFGF